MVQSLSDTAVAGVAVKTRVVDRGLDAIVRHARSIHSRGVKIGIQAGAGLQDGVSLLDILVWNEFGTRNAPARPVMRSYFDSDLSHLTVEAERAATFMQRTGQIDVALNRVGQDMQARLQAHWRASKSWAVPNTEFTIKMKGSDVPLIDNATLINAVRYQVV